MTPIALSDEQRLDWLRLIRSERVGPRTFRALINQFGGARAALDALPDLARRTSRHGLKITSSAEAERELAQAGRLGARFVAEGEAEYPRALLAIDTAPPLIAIRGNAAVLARPSVAIVGSRNASASGGVFAERIARDLGRESYVVVSGLARGIDARAHRAALATGTVAVLAGGHDRLYPSEHEPLLDEILAQGGCAVSEMPLGWTPRGRDFPRRNRIVSGLSYGVVVVEAALRSGSLITARFALEQGREVFAVPGSPLDPRAAGTNELIRAGATLCASAEHVSSVLEPLVGRGGSGARPSGAEEPARGRSGAPARLWDELYGDEEPMPLFAEAEPEGDLDGLPERERVLGLLGASPTPVDDVARQSGLPIREVQLALVELEVAGLISRHANNAVSRHPGMA